MKPHWPDHCEHGDKAYCGTFYHNGKPHDVYMDGNTPCIRRGSNPEDYWSPSNIESMQATVKQYPDFWVYVYALETIAKKPAKA